MKIRTTAACFLALTIWALVPVTGRAQDAQPAQIAPSAADAVPSAPAVDPAKEADIRKLLDMTAAAAMSQMMNTVLDNMRGFMTTALPPGDYRATLIDLFIAKFRSKTDVRELLDMVIPIYDKYLSRDDINGLIQFYGTPLGQKTLSSLPKITLETQDVGAKWGERVGRESMAEVLSEHPDLETALEMAARQNAPR